MRVWRPAVWTLMIPTFLWGEAQAAPKRELPPELSRRARPAPKRTRPGAPVRLTNRGSGRTTGDYRGVTPGLPRMPRIRLPRNAHKRCYLTWTGFQLLPTGSRIFAQFNKRPKVIRSTRGAAMTVKLPGCGVASWNNTRPLYTRYFPTPVRYVRVRRRRGATWMSVLLKKNVRATSRVVKLQGWYYLFLTFRHTRKGWTYTPKRRTRRVRRSKKRPRRPRGPRP